MKPAHLFFGAFVVVVAVSSYVCLSYFRLWLQAFMAGARISLSDLLGMTFRKVNAKAVVSAKIMAVQAGLPVDPSQDATALSTFNLECHYLAGGDVVKVVMGLIAAKRANVDVSFSEACAIDLSSRDVIEEVNRRSNSTR